MILVLGVAAGCGGAQVPGSGGPVPASEAPSPAPTTAASTPTAASTLESPTAQASVPPPGPTPAFQVVGYFPEWGGDALAYPVREIETRRAADRLTVLAYAFSEPRPDANGTVTCQITDPEAAY